jgi:hypothetical protein
MVIMSKHTVKSPQDDVAAMPDHFVLGLASRDSYGKDEDGGKPRADWSLSVIGYPDPDHYGSPIGVDGPICQAGRCPNCRAEIVSTSKHQLCPVCGSKSYGT